jgi:hypothetical protein
VDGRRDLSAGVSQAKTPAFTEGEQSPRDTSTKVVQIAE